MAKNIFMRGLQGPSWSWKRAFGLTQLKQKFARKTGIPTTQRGIEMKIGRSIIQFILNFFKKTSA